MSFSRIIRSKLKGSGLERKLAREYRQKWKKGSPFVRSEILTLKLASAELLKSNIRSSFIRSNALEKFDEKISNPDCRTEHNLAKDFILCITSSICSNNMAHSHSSCDVQALESKLHQGLPLFWDEYSALIEIGFRSLGNYGYNSTTIKLLPRELQQDVLQEAISAWSGQVAGFIFDEIYTPINDIDSYLVGIVNNISLKVLNRYSKSAELVEAVHSDGSFARSSLGNRWT